MKRMLVLFYLALLTFGAVGVEAHAFLERANPGVGSTIKASPKEVSIHFSEAVEPAFSTIQVLNAAGKEVDKRDLHLTGSDQRQLAVSLTLLRPGTYTVVWRAVSVDTHVTNGKFHFIVSR